MRKLYVCILALLCVISFANQLQAQHSAGPAPVTPASSASKGDVILPDVANPASRAFVYAGPGPFQFNKQTLSNTVLTPVGAAVPFQFPGAAAWVTTTNKYYVIDQLAPFALYTVDTVTGVRTFIANCSGVPLANFTGMTWDRTTNTMYGIATNGTLSQSQIFTLNITTGVCTPIGVATTTCPGAIMLNAAPGGSLFAVDLVNDQLFRWNKTTGVPTLVGGIGFNANFGQDGHFDLSDGQYYYAAFNNTTFNPELRTIDTLTGATTLIGTYPGGGAGQVQTMGIYTPLTPNNDDCANAIALNCGQTVTGTTAQATIDGPPITCTGSSSIAADVWYTVVGTGANITAILCGSAYDTKIDVYTGNCGALVCVGGNDDFCGLQSQFSWATTLGTVYRIRVHGFGGATGAFTLNIACQPVNDACSGAININCGQSINGTTVGGSIDVVPFCGFAVSTSGVWYTFIGSGGVETVNTCAAFSFDTRIDVFSGTCGSLVSVGCNDDFCGVGSQVTFPTTAGTRYYILVHGFGSATGTFTLTRNCQPCAGVPSPGAISGSSGPYCPGSSVTLNLTGNTIANGITYQWRSSLTPGGPYTAIPGATNPSYTFNTTTTTYFIVSVNCTNPGGGTGNTVEFPVNVSNLVHSGVVAAPNVACSPGATTISGTVSGTATLAGNYTHTLTGPGIIGAPVVSGARNATVSFPVTVIPAGVHTYVLTSTDPIGCTVVTNVTMTVNQTPIITLTTTPGPTPPAPPGTNYVYTTTTGNAIVPGTALVPGTQGDDVTAVVPIPFGYDAYGTVYNSLIVSSNGNIQFSGAGNTAFTNTCPLPTATTLGFPAFMPHWDDLRTDINAGDGIYTSVSGVAPNRIFNIEWRATLFGIGGTINFEARLFEGQQRVDFIYGNNTNNGSSASIGVQGANTPTTLFTSYSCNNVSLGAGLRISFVLPAPVVICNGDIVRIDASSLPPTPQTFSSNVNTHIPAGGNTSGIASPYPNSIPVSGLLTSGVTVKSVTITGFSHTLPDDVDIVLVSPSGQSVILMSDAGGNPPATGQTFTFDDAAAATLFDAAFNPSGTYKPTNYGAGDSWPLPGPLGAPSSTSLASITGNPNGNWNLYVVDDNTNETGFIATWSLTLNVPQPVVFSPTTNLFTDASATTAYTGTPVYTVWARPSVNTTYTASNTTAGCSNGASVAIVVNYSPAITTQPVALAAPICPGFNANYNVVATGTNLTYQWQVSLGATPTPWSNISNGAQYSGTNTPNLTVLNTTTAQNGHRFRVVISGVCPPTPIFSDSIRLTVATTPTITTQPANRTVCAPDAAVFTVATGGVPAPTIYQWQVSPNGNPAGPWTNLTTGGSYTPTLTVSPTTTAMNGSLYRVIVTNNCNQSITSGNAVLTVNAATPVTIAALPSRICLTDTLVPLSATPVGGSWSGTGVSGFNFVPPITAVGSYTLTYSYVNASNCPSSATVVAQVQDCPERIRRLAQDAAVILFPNPNNGRFSFRVNSTLYNFLGMRVYNNAGQLLQTQVFNGLVYGRTVPVDLSHLPAGAYMVKFTYDDGVRTSEKTFPVIIQRK
ncbi:MAG TPA: T9SS type A sorting domain-containing protein [Chitinophagaceae bacterium]|nr:T9SS type A sorting domain-containing protein [Chitinophagaceae bacterium]